MDTVTAHYRSLLARHYTWMLGGDVERAAAQQRHLLESLGVAAPDKTDAVAVDLGCGPGPQTLALADMGFGVVVGVDTSQELLDELLEHARSRPAVKAIRMDLVDALPTGVVSGPVEVVVCMGDTVLHLADRETVTRLIGRVAASLGPGGAFVLTYRDLTQPLQGLGRFMPVRSDDERIMLCALDYEQTDMVTVNDLVYTRGPTGWALHKSRYHKLRIGADWLRGSSRGRDSPSIATLPSRTACGPQLPGR